MHAHRMHLRGPWKCEWLEPLQAGGCDPETDLAGGLRRVKMPAEWREVFGDAGGRARFRRRFHRPTNLEPHERVFIVFDGIGGRGEVRLNGTLLGPISPEAEFAAFEVTPHLEAGNELTVEIAFDGAGAETRGGLWGPVALEVRGEADRNAATADCQS